MRRGSDIAAVAVTVLIVSGVGLARPAFAADAQPMVPQSSVGDVAALTPSERAAFFRGYLTALAFFDVDYPACMARWFYEKGGADKLEKSMLARGPSFDAEKQEPIGERLQEEAFGECGQQCYGPVGPPTPRTPYPGACGN